MEPQLFDPDAGNYGKICVPPEMQAQIEILTTVMVLLPMKQAVLQGLHKLVMSNDPKAWFTIYLVMFILLHSCGLLTKAERARCLREALVGSKVSYSIDISSFAKDMSPWHRRFVLLGLPRKFV